MVRAQPMHAQRQPRASVVGSVTCGSAMPGLSLVGSAAGAALEKSPMMPRPALLVAMAGCCRDGGGCGRLEGAARAVRGERRAGCCSCSDVCRLLQ